MGKPSGDYVEQLTEPGGWTEADEDKLYEVATQATQALRQLTFSSFDPWQHQRSDTFDGGNWSGDGAGAADGKAGKHSEEFTAQQDNLVKVVTWNNHVAGLVTQAKSKITDNVEEAQNKIKEIKNQTLFGSPIDALMQWIAIHHIISTYHGRNVSEVTSTGAEIPTADSWKSPPKALEQLLKQKQPAAATDPSPNTPLDFLTTSPPAGSPPVTSGNNGGDPLLSAAEQPQQPTPKSTPPSPGSTNPSGTDPLLSAPEQPQQPTPESTPPSPGSTNPSGTDPLLSAPEQPQQPTPSPGTVTPAVTPAPTPTQTPRAPSGTPTPPVSSAASPTATPSAGTPSSGTPASGTPTGTPAATPTAQPTAAGSTADASAGKAPVAPMQTSSSSSPMTSTPMSSPSVSDPHPVTPAPASTTQAGPTTAGASGPTTAAPSGGPSGGGATGGMSGGGMGSGGMGGSGMPLGAPPTAPPAAPVPPTAAAAAPPPVTAAPTPQGGAQVAPIPVSAARAEREAAQNASRRNAGEHEPLNVARRIAAALNASDMVNVDDFFFHWITAVTKDGKILVANNYGLAYIPEQVHLPQQVVMVTADESIPAAQRGSWATYPIVAVQHWAQHHGRELRAVIGTEEQLAGTDSGAHQVILAPEDIPASGRMSGRDRLQVIAPHISARLAGFSDADLIGVLPPAPAASNPPEDQRTELWDKVWQPLCSSASNRGKAHLQAFLAYAVHAQEHAFYEVHTTAEAADQRKAADAFIYWQHVGQMIADALAT